MGLAIGLVMHMCMEFSSLMTVLNGWPQVLLNNVQKSIYRVEDRKIICMVFIYGRKDKIGRYKAIKQVLRQGITLFFTL